MAWSNSNITQDGSGYASQTSTASVGVINSTAMDADEYPCLYVDEIDFGGIHNVNGGTFTAMFRYVSSSSNLKAEITAKSNNLYDFTVSETGGNTLYTVSDQPMPTDNVFTLVYTLDCGEVLSAKLMEHSTGQVLHYVKDTTIWIDEPDNEVRIELGPAGVQGPRINGMTLSSRGDCNAPDTSSYTLCTDNVTVIDEDFDPGTTADIAIVGNYTSSTVYPNAWNEGSVDVGYPLNGQARVWAEFWDASGGLSATGDEQAYQFSNPFCFDVVDIGDYGSENNHSYDNIKRRDITAMVGFTPTTDSEGYTHINGLGVRLDFRSSTLQVGTVVNERIKESQWNRPLGTSSSQRVAIRPGTFQPFTGGNLLLSNLDQFESEKLTIEMDYACTDQLTVTIWADQGTTDKILGSVVASIDQAVIPADDLGLYFGAYAVGITKNNFFPVDDDSFNITCDQIRMAYDTDTPCS